MTILRDPIELPNPLSVNKKTFDLSDVQQLSPVGSGFIQTIDRTTPFWVAGYSTPPLNDEKDQVFQAFMDSLEGSRNTFLAYDPRRPRPYAYRNTSGESWLVMGAPAKVVDTLYESSQLRLTEFAPGAIITQGDYISFRDGYIWRLYRSKETLVADEDGNMLITVRPRPVPLQNICNLRLNKACAEMKVMGKYSKNDSVESYPTYEFTAVQYINRAANYT